MSTVLPGGRSRWSKYSNIPVIPIPIFPPDLLFIYLFTFLLLLKLNQQSVLLLQYLLEEVPWWAKVLLERQRRR